MIDPARIGDALQLLGDGRLLGMKPCLLRTSSCHFHCYNKNIQYVFLCTNSSMINAFLLFMIMIVIVMITVIMIVLLLLSSSSLLLLLLLFGLQEAAESWRLGLKVFSKLRNCKGISCIGHSV